MSFPWPPQYQIDFPLVTFTSGVLTLTNTTVRGQAHPATDFSFDMLRATTQERLKTKGITSLFPIQEISYRPVIDGSDVVAQARTGSGKTLAFALPTVERLLAAPESSFGRPPRVVVLAPTRELAKQSRDEYAHVAPSLSCICIYGGVAYDEQVAALRRGVDVVVGTPGRMKDLIQSKQLRLTGLTFVVLDEADRMFDMVGAAHRPQFYRPACRNRRRYSLTFFSLPCVYLFPSLFQGFMDDINEILEPVIISPPNGCIRPQVLLFSATMPPEIQHAVNKFTLPSRVHLDLIGKSTNKTSETVLHYCLKCPWSEIKSLVPDLVQVCGRRAVSQAYSASDCLYTWPESLLSPSTSKKKGTFWRTWQDYGFH